MDSPSENNKYFPEMALKMAKASWDGYFHFQQQWLETVTGKKGNALLAEKPQNPGLEMFKTWTDLYEKEFSRFLTIPQLGLTRFHQERTGEVLDKFNLFQGRMIEFIFFFFQPMEKSFKVMQEKLEGLKKEGKLSENPKDYYQVWVKVLEDYYLSLLKSAEYTETMNGALNALEEFAMARGKCFESFLQMFSIPTLADMDDLSKELYLLKKRLKELEKEFREKQPNLPARETSPFKEFHPDG